MSSSKQLKAATPRLSASLIVINSQNEVLLVQRNPDASTFAGVHVFPGGNHDADQDGNSLQMTAVRETFEETGLLLAPPTFEDLSLIEKANIEDDELDAAREAVHARRTFFPDFLSAHERDVDTSALLPFTRWTTPPTAPRRFHTHFFVTFLDSKTYEVGPTSGAHTHRLPTPDGGQEVVSARFVRPRDALALTLMPPQYYLLSTLADVLSADATTIMERQRVRDLAQGAFGRMWINPRALPGKDERGRTVLTYEGDETRGGSEGRLHRSLVRMGKRGISEEVNLQRNFDVFTEIEEHAFDKSEDGTAAGPASSPASSKL